MTKRSKVGAASGQRKRRVQNRANTPAADQKEEIARLTRERDEARAQRTATTDVLRVISRSAGALEPVFSAILFNAQRICGAQFGNLLLFDGKDMRVVAMHNASAEHQAMRQRDPVVPLEKSILGPLVRSKTLVHIDDITAVEPYASSPLATAGGMRTALAVPMLRDDELVGAIGIFNNEVRPFTNSQIELLQNFAAQAVIAIENARLLNELKQSLERQTATSEVLQVISSSPGALKPVFQTMLKNATRICEAKYGVLYLYDGQHFSLATHIGAGSNLVELMKRGPITPHPDTILGRIVSSKNIIEIEDARKERGYLERNPVWVAGVEEDGALGLLGVPILKEEMLVGAFVIFRPEVRPFTDKQIALVENFAAQAVIAIENARLLNELRQSLEQQTATAEVLKVVSSLPDDLEPVFAAMLERAVRICDAKFGNIYRWDGEVLNAVASRGTPSAFVDARQRISLRPGPKDPVGVMIATKKAVHTLDLAASASYAEGEPLAVAAVELGGVRTLLAVPMLKENELTGAFTLNRQEVRPFTDKEIALVTGFAAQAVIAIENVRLLNELRQSLEQQTATANVLEVISRSAFDLRAVFKTVAESSVRLCGADRAFIFRFDGEMLRMAVAFNSSPEFEEWVAQHPIRPGRHSGSARAALERRTIHIPDVLVDPEYVYGAKDVEPIRTVLGVPILKGDELLGVMMIYHLEVSPFTEQQIALVETFADQAAIAIENVRLLEQLRERTEEVEKLNQHLEQRVADQVGEIERMGRLRRFLPPQVADLIVASGTEKQLESHRREITALFCDLRGFTGFTESADAEDVMSLLRDYHAAFGQIIIKYGGTLERYAGDGVMVIFNDPVPIENPARQAVLMALELRDAIGAMTEKWRRLGHEIGFGIGIAHGFATLGTIGFEGRFDYAAIGTVSNVASRLCDEAKPGQILISPRVLMAVEDVVKVEPVGEFALKGIRRPLAAYNVLEAVSGPG